ncbi:hypothetical protein HJG60_009927 [Phyllostomus discolor]|uniref:Uncharacterized protein n=1 Tax=Phyllostomus discolor TaxID=89673 RepID=A0A834EQL9_9CHIR|nr:hypothetical protein HJG60_009927 [Phyllostomus discolor]
MLSDKVRMWKEGIQGIHLPGRECGIQRGVVIFLGIALNNFLADINHGLTLRTGHEEKEAQSESISNFERNSEGTTSSLQTIESYPNCLNKVFINLSKKLSLTVPIKEFTVAGFPVYLSLHVCFGDQKVVGLLDTCISGLLIRIIPMKLYKIIS